MDIAGFQSTVMDCTGWSMNRTADLKQYASCSTNGRYAYIPGIISAAGDLRGYTDDENHISEFFDAGDTVLLYLFLSATKFHQVPAVIENVQEDIQIEEAGIVGWTASYKSQGDWLLWQG